MLILIVITLVLSITALISSLITVSKVAKIASRELVVEKAVEEAPEKPVKEPVEEEPAEVIKISGGFESLEDLATLTGLDSIFLFNLSGMPIDSYNMKEEEHVAASLADFISTLEKLGFPAEVVILKNGMKALLLKVKRIGDVEVCALMIGKPEIEVRVEEVKELLQAYVSDLVKGGRE